MPPFLCAQLKKSSDNSHSDVFKDRVKCSLIEIGHGRSNRLRIVNGKIHTSPSGVDFRADFTPEFGLTCGLHSMMTAAVTLKLFKVKLFK
jgi:hypothetical protein